MNMNPLSVIKNFTPFIVIALICGALWMLNARNLQLEATNHRLTRLADSKDHQIKQLRGENNSLASSITDFIAAVEQQNELLETVTAQREIANRENRELQNEIISALKNDKCAAERIPADAVDGLRRAAKNARAAGGIPNGNATTITRPVNPDQPNPDPAHP